MDPNNVKSSEALRGAKPKTIGEVRKLLGFLGYFIRYIKDFARIAKPLASPPNQQESPGKGKTMSCYPVTCTDKHSTTLNLLLDSLVKL